METSFTIKTANNSIIDNLTSGYMKYNQMVTPETVINKTSLRMRKCTSRHKQVSIELITRILKQSKSQKCPIVLKGTGLFVKYTQEDESQWRFVVYDRNPSICNDTKSIRMVVSKLGGSEIDGFDRLQKLAETCGVIISFKQPIIKLTRWEKVLVALSKYLSIPTLYKVV